MTMARITAGPFRSILPASTYGLGAALSTLATKNRLRFIYQPVNAAFRFEKAAFRVDGAR